MRRFLKLKREAGDMIPQISAEISDTVAAAGVSAEVQGREKRRISEVRPSGFSTSKARSSSSSRIDCIPMRPASGA